MFQNGCPKKVESVWSCKISTILVHNIYSTILVHYMYATILVHYMYIADHFGTLKIFNYFETITYKHTFIYIS